MEFIIKQLGLLIYATLLFAPPLLYAGLGSCFSEVSGVSNIGIEGMMVIGGFVGCAMSYFTNNPLLSFLLAGVAGGIIGLLHAFACIKLNANQTISGIAINMFSSGLAIMCSYAIFNSSDTIPLNIEKKIPILFKDVFDVETTIGYFLKNLFSNYVSTYLVFLLVIVFCFIFYKTKIGLRIRSCGENPTACDTLGIDVIKIRYFCVILSGFLSGLGGATITMAIINQFKITSMIGQGFVAIASVIFGKYTPNGTMIGCLIFGFCMGLKVVIGSDVMSPHLISLIPYLVTVLVLIIFMGESHVPKANGKPFIKAK